MFVYTNMDPVTPNMDPVTFFMEKKCRDRSSGVMEGNQRRWRPCRKWLDDIGDWCMEKIHTLSKIALDRDHEWRRRVKCTFDTYTGL